MFHELFFSTERVLEGIFSLSTFLTSPSSVDDILQKLLDKVVETMGFQRGIICLIDEKKEHLLTKVVKNYTKEEAQKAFHTHLNIQKHDCLETRVAKTGNYIALEDSETDPRITKTDQRITKFYKRGSTFYAPLKIEDEVIGIICLWSTKKTKFYVEEINILLTLANQISVVIYNTRLFEDNREKINRLLTLQEAVSQINARYEIDEIHNIVIKNGLKIGKADKAFLYFLDVKKDVCLISNGQNVVIDSDNKYSSKIWQSIIKQALDSNTIITGESVSSDSALPLFEGYKVEIAVPFKIKDKFKGTLYLAKKKGIFSIDQINVLDILIKNAATSYDNAIMHSLLSLEAKSLKREVEKLKKREVKLMGFHNIIGNSQNMEVIFHIIKEVAPRYGTNILIQGESGTGKELIARAIHRQSDRKSNHFVDVNCAAIPGTLLESELFGYEAGAFTDARKRKTGLLEYANGGTLLLDEIGEMSLPLQAKLLRLLEDGYIRRLGGTDKIPVDVRFIFATNRDLNKMVNEGTFREDLFYRISVIPIHIPPLRERGEDIILLAQHYIEDFNHRFNKRVKGFSMEAEEILIQYHWPGNVRELKNIIERIMILQNVSTVITPKNLPIEIKNATPKTETLNIDSTLSLHPAENIEYKSIINRLTSTVKEKVLHKAIELSQGNKTLAAKRLGISRYTLIRELKKIEIEQGAIPNCSK